PVNISARPLAFLYYCRRRREYESIDLLNPAMDHGEAQTDKFESNSPRQACHPGSRIGPELRQRVREPGRREALTRAACRNPGAAIIGAACQALFAIAHDDATPAGWNQVHGGGCVGAIGHDIVGADHVLGVYSEACGLFEESLRRLEVAVGAAENHQRALGAGAEEMLRRDHF